MMTGTSDYGVLFQRSASISGTYADFGRYVDVGFPELSMDEVDGTNHGSGGVQQFLMSRLLKMSDFDVVFIMDSSMLTTAYNDLSAGSSAWYRVTYPGTTSSKAPWQFESFVKAVKADKSADATKPEMLKASVTFRPTGGVTGLA